MKILIALLLSVALLLPLPAACAEQKDVPPAAITAVAVIAVLFFAVVLLYALRAQFSKVMTGREGLVGETGVAVTPIAPNGKIMVHGEYWDAESTKPIGEGERVVVSRVEGMRVSVKKQGG